MSCLAGSFLGSLLDSQSNYFTPGLPVFYRIRNFNETLVGPGVEEYGFQVSPSVYATSGEFVTGTTDYQICPQPSVELLTLKQVADATNAGSIIRSGARMLNISNSWVSAVQQQFSYSNPRLVFTHPSVVGFYQDGLLFEIVSYIHNDMYGTTINWDIICNASNDIK